MGHPVLYVERVAANATLGMGMTACEPELAPDLAARYGEEPLREGLRALRSHFTRLYADMGARPAAYGIPLVPDARVHEAAQRRKVRGPFEAPLKLLYALGLAGELREAEGAYDLVADRAEVSDLCRAFGVRDFRAALAALASAGFAVKGEGAEGELVAESGILALPSRAHGLAPMALKAFVDVCRHWERRKLKARQMPYAFVLADFRILRRTGARARLPKVTVPEILPYAPSRLAEDARALFEHAISLGYQAEVEAANLLDGEWHARFIGRAHGKSIGGFTICRGGLHLRLSSGDLRRLLPYLDDCPAGLRRELLSGGCARCGGSGCGREVKTVVDGEERVLCHYGLLYVSKWEPPDIEPLKGLYTVVARFHGG